MVIFIIYFTINLIKFINYRNDFGFKAYLCNNLRCFRKTFRKILIFMTYFIINLIEFVNYRNCDGI